MKRTTKRIAIVLLVALIILTIPLSVFAADYEGYLSMIDMNQYGFSIPSGYPAPFGGVFRNRAVQLRVNGQVAYCIEFGVLTQTGMGYNGSNDWDGLSSGDKLMVGYVIGGTVNTSWEDGLCDHLMGSGSVAKSIYYQIKANVYSFNKIPSFTSRLISAAPTHELIYNIGTGLFEVTLNDTNSVLSSFNFQASGYTMTRSGNSLKITAATPPNDEMIISAVKTLPTTSAGVIKYWHPASSSYQMMVTYQVGGFNDPVNAYFKLKISTGNIETTKTTEDGKNLADIEFTAKSNNGVTRTLKTGASGKLTFIGLPMGVYTVTENPNSHHPQYITAAPQTVTVLAGQTHKISFYNEIKKGQIALTKLEPTESDELHKVPLPDVTFTVTRKDTGAVACTLVTDANGYAITPLLNYGVYTVTETYVEGYTLLDPFEVFIDTDGKVYTYFLENKVYESMLKIVKADAETGKTIPIAGTRFRIEDNSGQTVVQMIYYPTPTEISEFETAADGSLMLPQPLPYGTYKL